jgi:hypothetical protein
MNSDPRTAHSTLAAVARSQLAARRPQLLPPWYGAAVAVLLGAMVACIDLSNALHAEWIFGIATALCAIGMSIAVVMLQRQQGVVAKFDRRYAVLGLLLALITAAVALGVFGLAYAAGLGWPATAAGIAVVVTFLSGSVVVNRRIRRDIVEIDAELAQTKPA